jgi:hypothetical protein
VDSTFPAFTEHRLLAKTGDRSNIIAEEFAVSIRDYQRRLTKPVRVG